MIEQLNTILTIYDLLALCSSYILKELLKNSYEFRTFKDSKYEKVEDAIELYGTHKENYGEEYALDELKKFVSDYLYEGINIERCYAVVKYIDEYIEVKIDEGILHHKGYIVYSSMNRQYTDQVRIIPKVKNSFVARGEIAFQSIEDSTLYSLFRKRRECACSLLDEETSNYMIWDQEHMNKFPMRIYHLDEKNPIAKHFAEREKIVFGIVPLTKEPLDDIFDIRYDEEAFYIEKMHRNAEDKLINRYIDSINRCKDKDIDFLIFPEMLMSDYIMKNIYDKKLAGILSSLLTDPYGRTKGINL